MKNFIFAAAVSVVLVACTDKPVDPSSTTAAPPPPGLATVVVGVPSELRPPVIPAALTSTGQCSIDHINAVAATETTTLVDKTRVTLDGWAADATTGSLPKSVFLELEGPVKRYLQANLGVSRPDVATHFQKPALANAGWEVLATLADLPPGSYVLRVIQVGATDTGTLCDARRTVFLPATGG